MTSLFNIFHTSGHLVQALPQVINETTKYAISKIYTVVHKKRDTFIFLITLANIDGFS